MTVWIQGCTKRFNTVSTTVKSPSLKVIIGDYLQWGTPVCLVFLNTIPLHLKLAHHCSLAVLHVSVQYFKWLFKKKPSGTVDFYSGREVADWPVEWWGGWLGLHRDSAAVTPSHHCQMSSV